jgi:hypothetical protein
MTDHYLFAKSTIPQNIDETTPFVSKNWNYINDINGGVYQNSSGLSLVQFDLSSIYNSTQLLDPSTSFLAIPITYVSAYSTGSALVAPVAGSYASTALKNGYFQLVHGVDLSINGRQVESFTPNINAYVSFKMLSQMSQDDLATYGSTLGMGQYIDDYESMIFNGSGISQASGNFPSATPTQGSGNGLCNNTPFPISQQWSVGAVGTVTASTSLNQTLATANPNIKAGMLVTGNQIVAGTFVSAISGTALTLSVAPIATTVAGQALQFLAPISGNQGDQSTSGVQWAGSYNRGLFSRIKRITDVSANPANGSPNLYTNATGTQANCISNITKLGNEFKPYYTVMNTHYMVWHDIAIVRMCDICDVMKNLPMMKKFDATMRLYLNVGQVVSNLIAPTGNNSCLMVSSGSGNTFTNTCPLVHSNIFSVPQTATSLASGLFIGSPTTTAINVGTSVVNLANSGASHFMTACRFYYNQIQLKPERLDYYISNNRSKQVCWTSVLNNNFNNIAPGATFSTLVQSGISNPKGILILPFLSNATGSQLGNYSAVTTNGTALNSSITTVAQQQSPYDQAPFQTSCASIINLQVAIGGVNVLSNVMSWGWEEFIEQVSLVDKINASDFGLSCGLINQAYYEHAYRVYYVDLSRSNVAELMTPRNITISLTNNSLQPLDLQVFIEQYKSGVVDVETGIFNI